MRPPPTAPRPSLYDILGVEQNCTPDELKAAYRAATVRNHPDTGGTAASFRAVQSAFEILSDASTRTAYDKELSIERGETFDEEPPPPPRPPRPDASHPPYDDQPWAGPSTRADYERNVNDRNERIREAEVRRSAEREKWGSWGRLGWAVKNLWQPILCLAPLIWITEALYTAGILPTPGGAHNPYVGSGLSIWIQVIVTAIVPGILLRYLWLPYSWRGKIAVLGLFFVVLLIGPALWFGFLWAWAVFFWIAIVLFTSRWLASRDGPATKFEASVHKFLGRAAPALASAGSALVPKPKPGPLDSTAPGPATRFTKHAVPVVAQVARLPLWLRIVVGMGIAAIVASALFHFIG